MSSIILLALLAQTTTTPAPEPPTESQPAPAALDPELAKALANDAQSANQQPTTPPASTSDASVPTPASAAPLPSPTPTAATSFNPDIAVILDVAAAAFSKREPRQGGHHDPNKNGFTIQQVELALGKAVDPYFRLDAYIVFTPEEIEVEEAYATTTALPYNLQVRAGQFLTRFGRHNPTHPHAWAFLDQPFVMSRMFGGEANRGAGAEVSWLSPLPWYVELLASVTEAAGEGTARSFFGAMDRGVGSPLDLQATFAAKQFFAPSDDLSILWGLSAALGPNPTGNHTRTGIYGTDLFLKYRPVTSASNTVVSLQIEPIYRRRQIPGGVLQDAGGYANLFWRFAQRWGAGARYEYGTPIWDGHGNRAEDYIDPLWQGTRQRVTGAITFWPTEFSRLRLQGSVDDASGDSSRIWAGMIALEVLAGAHGAHAF